MIIYIEFAPSEREKEYEYDKATSGSFRGFLLRLRVFGDTHSAVRS